MTAFTPLGVLLGCVVGLCFVWFFLIAAAGCKSDAAMIGVGCLRVVAAAAIGIVLVFGSWVVEQAEMLSP
ncbi:MAG: hypothetical protein BGO49_00550 [Planctomycetales bacterium 71-10]|nr:MAG: hypothetical protein BGO49_00550 [Planctomycetales bacterium 71-10]